MSSDSLSAATFSPMSASGSNGGVFSPTGMTLFEDLENREAFSPTSNDVRFTHLNNGVKPRSSTADLTLPLRNPFYSSASPARHQPLVLSSSSPLSPSSVITSSQDSTKNKLDLKFAPTTVMTNTALPRLDPPPRVPRPSYRTGAPSTSSVTIESVAKDRTATRTSSSTSCTESEHSGSDGGGSSKAGSPADVNGNKKSKTTASSANSKLPTNKQRRINMHALSTCALTNANDNTNNNNRPVAINNYHDNAMRAEPECLTDSSSSEDDLDDDEDDLSIILAGPRTERPNSYMDPEERHAIQQANLAALDKLLMED